MAEFDLVVRGGTVHDGNGSAARTADVAIRDGLIVEVGTESHGQVSGAGNREVDASGALVTPGFVDIHAHYDGQATWDNNLAPSSWHGVTTAVMGNCGVGFAPVHDEDHERLIQLMEGVEDIPGAALSEGLAWNWRTFGEYLDAVDERPHDIDVAAQVPHGALRLHVMGERGAALEDATPDDIDQMARLATEGIAAGALGFTTSRTANHRTSTGDPTPTLTAAAEELIGIAAAMGKAQQGVLQLVSDFKDSPVEIDMLHQMMAVSGRPLSVTVAVTPTNPMFGQQILDGITAARSQGLAMTGQVGTRPIGLIFGLELTLNPFMRNPVYMALADLPLPERVARLRQPEVRQALLDAAESERADGKVGGRLISKFGTMFELSDPPNYEPALNETVQRRAEVAGTSAEALALDLLLADDGQGLLYVPFANYVDGSLDSLRDALMHEHTVPGLGDGGAHVGTICDGSFPTTYLSHWGRDRDHGRIDLSYLIQQHCRDTARTVGLNDRGVLAPGYRADLNIIDFDNLQAARPHLSWDLPAGGRRLMQRATGYSHTFVAGVETYADGVATGALPGRLVRGAQPTPTA